MNFKYARLEEEFSIISPHLRAMLFEADYYSKTYFNKEIIITELLRNQKTQNEYYKHKIEQGLKVVIDGKVYYSLTGKYPTVSVHQVGRGADLRSSIYTPIEIENLCAHIRKYFPYNKKHSSCIYHSIGRGFHFHLQTIIGGDYDYSKYLQ